MAPPVRFELTANRLTGDRSTAELQGNKVHCTISFLPWVFNPYFDLGEAG
jgi:hypothetical protein